MPSKRVIVHYLHESEEKLTRTVLPGGEFTDAYAFGELESAAIENLRRQGLIVHELASAREDAVEEGAPMRARGGTLALGGRGGGVEVTLAEPPTPSGDYYVLALHGPLLEGRRRELDEYRVKLLEHLGSDRYAAYVPPDVLGRVSALAYVSSLREYRPRDKGVSLEQSTTGPAGITGGAAHDTVCQYDLRLHLAGDLAGVLDWLRARGITIVGAKERKIRIVAVESQARDILGDLAVQPGIAQIEEYREPELHNDVARGLLGLGGNPHPNVGMTGQGEVVGVADTGIDEAHPDLAGRLHKVIPLGRPGDASDPHGHGTHVAGSIVGTGAASGGRVRGTAPGARIVFQSLLDDQGRLGGLPLDLGELFEQAYAQGARIHNNSWGALVGSEYTMSSLEVDQFVASHRDMLVVISAGNEGTGRQVRRVPPGNVDWLSICAPASAKNALSVGASRSTRTDGGWEDRTFRELWPSDYPLPPIADERVAGDAEGLAAFSSRGPCTDHRIKPDLVAPGTNIVSTRASTASAESFSGPYSSASYGYMGGTSMSAPLVSGCAALVRQYWREKNHEPSAALVKATLLNGTRKLTAPDAILEQDYLPNFHQGFGVLDMRRVLPNSDHPRMRLDSLDPWRDATLAFRNSGQRLRFRFLADPDEPLHLCLVWTDAPGRGLQNNLDLFLEEPVLGTGLPGRKHTGNEEVPDALTPQDSGNNVEIIRLATPPAGSYLVQITARNIVAVPQDFALVVSGALRGTLTQV